MRRMSGPAIMKERKVKSTRWLAALQVCACDQCCALEPWRREVKRINQRKLKRSHAMSGARW
jgi:hypothetical protein